MNKGLLDHLSNPVSIIYDIPHKEVTRVTENAKRAIVWLVFAAGLILGLIGWTSVAYSPITGTIVFLCLLFVSIALRILWGLKKRKGE